MTLESFCRRFCWINCTLFSHLAQTANCTDLCSCGKHNPSSSVSLILPKHRVISPYDLGTKTPKADPNVSLSVLSTIAPQCFVLGWKVVQSLDQIDQEFSMAPTTNLISLLYSGCILKNFPTFHILLLQNSEDENDELIPLWIWQLMTT